jgi:hypothetical protein
MSFGLLELVMHEWGLVQLRRGRRGFSTDRRLFCIEVD